MALTRLVIAPDGRQLAVEQWGDPHGHPVFLLHGTPGGRCGPRPRGPLLCQRSIRLLAYDRPGYGRSDRLRGRRVANAATDIVAIADDLGIERFALVGRSGGAPHALAVAVLAAHRVTKVAALVALAPRDAIGLDWYAGMTESNVAEYSSAERGLGPLSAWLSPYAEHVRDHPEELFADLDPELPDADRRLAADFGVRTMMRANFTEALRTSGDGWIDDALALSSPWGFDPADIQLPALLWHGLADVFSPLAHTLWLADRIPRVRLMVAANTAHLGAIAVLPQVLSWLCTA
jgi:pimeloyl-ACP methyl ester carboxylesterase